MSEMLDKIKDMLKEEITASAPVLPPLEEAVAKALYSLDEIKIYGTYNRPSECVREATEAYDAIKALWVLYQEQQPKHEEPVAQCLHVQ
jgi:hypothetical protein